MGKVQSFDARDMGGGSYFGQYVHDSPYALWVAASSPSARASTASGAGLSTIGTAGVPITFMVTVRDAWDNVVRRNTNPSIVKVTVIRSPSTPVSVWDYKNGSYHVQYTPMSAGNNLIGVFVNSMHIVGSPFSVEFVDGKTSNNYSYATGPGLSVGTAGVPSVFEIFAFDLDNNRKSSSSDKFTFTGTPL
jgi:hypothetical protein